MKRAVPLSLVWVMMLFAGPALAEDITTLNRKEYKNVTVTRIEPDGIMIRHSAGIVKIPFTELPDAYREKYGYDAEKAAQYSSAQAKRQEELRIHNAEVNKKLREERERAAEVAQETSKQIEKRQAIAEASKKLGAFTIYAVVEPFSFGKERTMAWIQPYVRYNTGIRKNPSSTSLHMVPVYDWKKAGKRFIGVIDEPMKEEYEHGDVVVVALYKIGHTDDSSRHPLFTSKPAKALALIAGVEP